MVGRAAVKLVMGAAGVRVGELGQGFNQQFYGEFRVIIASNSWKTRVYDGSSQLSR